MDPTRIALFDLAERRLAWAGRRQAVLAQNVANADTPAYRPRDIAAFDKALSAAGSASALLRTDSAHLVGTADLLTTGRAQDGARQPDGNGVALDQELTKIADTDTIQSLTTSIYQTYLGLFRTALGVAGGAGG